MPLVQIWQGRAGLIGEEISFAELQQAVVQAQNVYRSAGYITSVVYLPQQNFVDNGMVLVRVVEGFIEDVEVRGANDGLRAYAERMLQRVEGGPNKTSSTSLSWSVSLC